MVGGGPVPASPGSELVAPVGGDHQAEVEAQAAAAGQGRGPAREGRGMSKTQVFVLPEGVESMCAFCVSRATHFIVVSYSYGDLKPACSTHARAEMYG